MCLCIVIIFHLDRGYSFDFLQPCAHNEQCENGICVPRMYFINYNYSFYYIKIDMMILLPEVQLITRTKGNVI